VVAVDAIGIGEEAIALAAGQDRGVVAVGRHHPGRRRRGGGLDQPEQRAGLGHAVDHELGVEDLVPAVLAVGLREHHQLDVGGIAAELGVGRGQVIDLVGRQRQAEGAIGRRQGASRFGAERDRAEGPRRRGREQPLVERVDHALGHAIGQRGLDRRGRRAAHHPRGGALDPGHRGQPRGVGDVGGLRRPRRDRAQARHDVAHGRAVGHDRGRGPLQHRVEDRGLVGGQGAIGRHQVDVVGGHERGLGRDLGDRRRGPGQPGRGPGRPAGHHPDRHAAPRAAAIRARASPGTGSKRSPVTCS
jgi:hypothetical protein